MFTKYLTLLLSFVCFAFFAGNAHAQASAARGKDLWEQGCAGCHGQTPAGAQVRRGSTVEGLRTAFNNIAAMSLLRTLSDAQLADLASYIRGDAVTQTVIKPQFNWTDIWYNPSESGWGINITQHADKPDVAGQIFAVMYAYDVFGAPIWYTVPGGKWISPTVFTGDVFRAAGPAQNGNFSSSAVRNTKVGTLTFTFTNRDAAQLNYTIESRTVNKMIERLKF
jgi:Cytochrome C oxidase, cbb3-type, subunit III